MLGRGSTLRGQRNRISWREVAQVAWGRESEVGYPEHDDQVGILKVVVAGVLDVFAVLLQLQGWQI
jgi:hypothetical protein